jgi:hypothetical protein
MSPRARAHKAPLKLVTMFGAKGLGGVAGASPDASRSGGPVPSGHLKSERPDASTLDPDIPLFLIGKSKDGFWVAREESGCAGGVFFTERGARQFATRWAKPHGCATMRVSQPLELDFKGDGNVFVPLIAAFGSEGNYSVPEPVQDVISVVLGLAAVAIAVWLTVTLLTLGR